VRLTLITAAVSFAFMAAHGCAQPVATVNGQPIYEKDLAPAIEGQMRQLRRQEHALKMNALEDLINRRLLEQEAAARGLSPERLLAEVVDSKVTPPAETEIEALYNAQKDRIGRPLEEVRAQIRQILHEIRIEQARRDYFNALRRKAKIEILLVPPKVDLPVDPARLRGDPKALVTIVEFSDFQCPFCQRVQATLREILAKYPGQVRLAYRDLPLEQIHPRARRAAEASRCAADQGKFWEYHDALFADISRLSDDDLKAHASRLSLDLGAFGACLESGKHREAVDQDIRAAAAAGVEGAPAFFINGAILEGAQPMAAFVELIERELAALKSGRTN